MRKNENFFDRISDYFSGDANQEVLKADFLKDSEVNSQFQWINRFWTSLNPKVGRADRIKQRTYSKIKDTYPPKQVLRLAVFKYAAIGLLILGLGSIAYYFSIEKIQMIQTSSEIGQVKVVELPDGSKVWLNAKSTICYPVKFKGDTREIQMDGEIYFEIKHDDKHPFIVRSEHVEIKVLGTSFLVCGYKDDPFVDTYLVQGSVLLDVPGLNKTMKLIPGDEVSYEKSSRSLHSVHHTNVELDSWRFGGVSFYNEPLSNIARKLERKFGVQIQILDESVQNMKYTADFESEGIEQILKFLSEGSTIQFQKTELGYTITQK